MVHGEVPLTDQLRRNHASIMRILTNLFRAPAEDGCLFFLSARSLTDDNEFICIEGFKDAEAGGTHVKQPYVKRFFDTAPDLVATQPQIIYIDTPHDGFGPMGEIQPR